MKTDPIQIQLTNTLVLFILSLILFNPDLVNAQSSLDIKKNDKVYVRVAKSDTATAAFLKLFSNPEDFNKVDYVEIEGRFVSFKDGIITLSKRNNRVVGEKTRYLKIFLANILTLNKQLQKKIKKGVIIGALTGVAVSVGLVGTDISSTKNKNSINLPALNLGSAIIVGSAIGAGVVFLFSRIFKKPKWETLYVKPGYDLDKKN